jgi:hypothetical protein
VVTTAGALATLLLGLAALSKKAHTSTGSFVLPDAARGSLRVALIFFGAAAIAALLTNFPVRFEYVDPADLKNLISDSSEDVAAAEENVGVTRTVILRGWPRLPSVYQQFCEQAVAPADSHVHACDTEGGCLNFTRAPTSPRHHRGP